ncbi:CCAAT-box DNA binding protein subunit B, putative [Babesia ovis]|uniref:CCAAT-box DNA binding protein subunit B, putative n=1 Tax=Babesia ovis TaxID=5869 RepID=A0A9W5WVN0_BABOV|nr:CCAAT-box DNA binding protein subunit B, putative [Babesia ovis]
MAQHESLSSNQRNLLSRATSATSEPTPGYVYKDITDMVVRDPSILPTVENYLLQKLERNEPYVKFKCLKLLKNLCTRLPHEFNRNKVCQSQAVVDARNYKAPYSEYNGDYLCHMVRNEVEDLLKVVYGQQQGVGSGAASGSDPNRMVGFGNMASANQGGYYEQGVSSGGFGNMPNVQGVGSGGFGNMHNAQGVGSGGFGNMHNAQGVGSGGFGNMPMNNTGYQNKSSGISSWFGSKASNNASYSNVGGPRMDGFGNQISKQSSSKSVGSSAFKLITDVATKYLPNSVIDKIERVGSTFVSSTSDKFERHVAPVMDMRRQPERAGYSGTFQTVDRHSPRLNPLPQNNVSEPTLLPSLIQDSNLKNNATEDISGESESKLVKEVLTFSGIKVTPSQQIIDDFLVRLKDLNVRYVVYELISCLNNRASNWQVQLRVLCFFEVLLTRANMQPDVRIYAISELEPILTKCREETRLKNKAERLIQLVGESPNTAHGSSDLISTSSSTEVVGKSTMQTTNNNTLDMDLFTTSNNRAISAKQPEPLRNVPSDFTNPAFDLMDSFSPVSSVRTPQGSQTTNQNKQKGADDLFDFDKLNINASKGNTSSTEQDLFAALDTVSFQPQAQGSTQLI